MSDSASTPPNRFSFTTVITKNLDGLASFYEAEFGMRELQRVRSSVNGEPVPVLFDCVERPPPQGE